MPVMVNLVVVMLLVGEGSEGKARVRRSIDSRATNRAPQQQSIHRARLCSTQPDYAYPLDAVLCSNIQLFQFLLWKIMYLSVLTLYESVQVISAIYSHPPSDYAIEYFTNNLSSSFVCIQITILFSPISRIKCVSKYHMCRCIFPRIYLS